MADELTPLSREILDNRARVIASEARLEREVAASIGRLAAEWGAAIEAFLRRRNLRDAEEALRRVEILRSLGRVTDRRVSEVERAVGAAVRAARAREKARMSEALEYHGVRVEARASLGGPGIRTARRALAQPVPGLGLTRSFRKASAAAELRMRRDVADAALSGWDVRKLVRKWSAGRGAGRIVRDAESVAITALHAAANEGAIEAFRERRAVERLQWWATFDRATCVACASLHGRVFTYAEMPPIPRHLRCRCVAIPVLDPDVGVKFIGRYVPPGGPKMAARDGRFDTWLKSRTPGEQADFLGSWTKQKAWKAGYVDLAGLVRADGTIRTDAEVLDLLTPFHRGRVSPPRGGP